jgi:Zn-finger nucleic acid-binding protein
MLRCQNCSAPLSGFKGRCGYCGGYNDVDRDLLMKTPLAAEDSSIPCPACGGAMKNMELGKDGDQPVCADQCGKCFGYFFPFFKLDVVLNDLARFGFLVDTGRLDDLSRNAPLEPAVTYRKCPVCAKLMNRINFGKRSGVVTDQCHGHGIWLDAGELRRLVEWRNSGGRMVDEEYRRQSEKEQEKRREMERKKVERWKREADRNSDGDRLSL